MLCEPKQSLSKRIRMKFFKRILFGLGIFSACLLVAGQPLFAMRQFEDFAIRAMAVYHVPGCSVAIVKDNEIAYAKGFGYRNVEHKLPVTPETIFAIGSCTKAFTATAIGVLVDQGKLDWDAPIKNYLPGFAMYDNKATEQLSLRDCLCHRSGLPRYDSLWNQFISRAELVDHLQYLKPTAPFREKWQYNNLMYMLAGYVLETVAGMPWNVFVQQYVTQPCGMNNTYFSASVVSTHSNAALAYYFDKTNQILRHVDYTNLDVIAPAASIHSSALDMAQWVVENLQGHRINSEIHKSQMFVEEEGEQCYYGFGWFKTLDEEIWHDGKVTGCSALVGFIPKEQVGAVVLANIEGVNDFDELLVEYARACMINDQGKISMLEKDLLQKNNDYC